MIQETITYLVIGFSILYTLYHMIKIFLPNKQVNKNYGCNGSCTACSAKRDIMPKYKLILR